MSYVSTVTRLWQGMNYMAISKSQKFAGSQRGAAINASNTILQYVDMLYDDGYDQRTSTPILSQVQTALTVPKGINLFFLISR